MNQNVEDIFRQIRETVVHINSHSTGHFISVGQLAVLEEEIQGSSVDDKDTGSLTAALRRQLSDVEEERAGLVRRQALATDSQKRASLNLEIQSLDSRIAKLKKRL